MPINESIGQYLRKFRLKNGLSTEDVAKFSEGLTPEKINAIERGQQPVALNELYMLANIYGIAADELVAFLFEMATQAEQEPTRRSGASR